MTEDQLSSLKLSPDVVIKEALKRLDDSSHRVVFVVDNGGILLGALSDGDIRRALLAGKSLQDTILSVFNSNPITVLVEDRSIGKCREIFLKNKILLIPIVDSVGRLHSAISWDEAFVDTEQIGITKKGQLDIPVVVMAGGKGTRLAPFTNVLPKPLIPVGEKTVLEVIIDSFRENGIGRFYFTVNYRGEMIKAYFDTIPHDYNVAYVWEKEFLGTAGCLRYLDGKIKETFIVSNCDIVVKVDYSDVIRFHKESGAKLTVISSIQHIAIPYGVVEFEKGGRVTSIREKPESTFTINTGVYVLEPECLELIPPGKFFHMTHLMERLINAGHLVCTYPVNEKDYSDIGQWDEYRKVIEQLGKQ